MAMIEILCTNRTLVLLGLLRLDLSESILTVHYAIRLHANLFN